MQRGLREVRRRDGCLPDRNLDPARSAGRLRFDPRLAALRATPKKDEQSPFGPRILYREPYQLLDQPGKDHLTRNCLRCFHDSLDVQLSYGRVKRGRRGGISSLAQARMAFIRQKKSYGVMRDRRASVSSRPSACET